MSDSFSRSSPPLSEPAPVPLPPLYLITDAERIGVERLLAAAGAAVSRGLRWIQVREPTWEPGSVRLLIERLRESVSRNTSERCRIVVGRRPELALELGLDGVHVGGGSLANVRAARDLLGPRALVGYSAHSLAEISAAAEAGADYVSFSPIFGAISKAHPLPPVGLEGLRAACAMADLPVYALGGVTAETAHELRKAGAAGAAMIGAILDSADPGSAVRDFLSGWTD